MIFFGKKIKNMPELPEIDDISVIVPAISQHLDAFRLPEVFQQASYDTLPVIDHAGKVLGIVSEFDLAKIIPDISMSEESYMKKVKVSDIMTQKVWTETEHTNIKDLLSKVSQMHARVVPIVDKNGLYTGNCITRTAIVNFLAKMVKPLTLGGLATPLGVYITDGIHQAGAKTPGLILNGIVFASIAFVINLLSNKVFSLITMPEFFQEIFKLSFFLMVLRFSPYSKIHAAEHQTINAIEKGFPLSVEAVRLQSRIHHRCGTNVLVLIIGIITVYQVSSIFSELYFKFLFIFLGFFIVLSYWQDMGRWLQKYFTTAETSDKLLENGIKAGEEILRLNKQDTRNIYPSFFSKIWNMGLFQIMVTFLTTLWVYDSFLARILALF